MAYNHKSVSFGNSHHCIRCLLDMENRIGKSKVLLQYRNENNGNTNVSQCVVGEKELELEFSTAMKNIFNEPLQCGSCNMIQYCSREHQIDDWETHKELCSIVTWVKRTFHVKHPLLILGRLDANKMQICVKMLRSLVYECLNRPLTKFETKLLTYPAYCAICYELQDLIPCVHCFGVLYCSMAHLSLDKQRHKEDCIKLRAFNCLYQVVPKQRDPHSGLQLRIADLQNCDLIETVERATFISVPKDPTSSFANYSSFAYASSFSYISSICLGMSYLELNYVKDSTYTIFIVGATDEESFYFQKMHMKFFFLQYDKLTKVELHFIGLYADEFKDNIQKYIYKHKMRSVTYKYFFGPLYQYIKKVEKFPPSLIVAFNPDFSECAESRESSTTQVTWADCIPTIVNTHQVPIFITSATEFDAKLDYESLLAAVHNSSFQIRCLCIFNLMKNPFADLRPLRNHRLSDSETICYRNKYMRGILTM